MNLVLKNTKDIRFHSCLKDIFAGIKHTQSNYNWLITDYECNTNLESLFGEDVIWIEGSKLTEITREEDIQFIWGVLSAFSKEIKKEDIDFDSVPRIRDHAEYWKADRQTQHPLAEFEIGCIDSSMTVIITENEGISNVYKDVYCDCIAFENIIFETENICNTVTKGSNASELVHIF